MRSLIFRLHARRSNLDKQVDVMKLEGGNNHTSESKEY